MLRQAGKPGALAEKCLGVRPLHKYLFNEHSSFDNDTIASSRQVVKTTHLMARVEFAEGPDIIYRSRLINLDIALYTVGVSKIHEH